MKLRNVFLSSIVLIALFSYGCSDSSNATDPTGEQSQNDDLKTDAQGYPVLTSVNMTRVGDNIHEMIATQATMDPGPAGENIAWDFSELTPSGTYYIIYGADPANTAAAASFPGATVAEGDSASSIRVYLHVDVSATVDLGLHQGSNGFLMKYSYPDTLYTYPFGYGSSQSGIGMGTLDNTLVGQQIRRFTAGTVAADAYGTLKLPQGTFSKVLRVKHTQTLIDSSYYDGQYSSRTVIEYEQYAWYAAGYRTPVARVVKYVGGFYDQKFVFYNPPAIPSIANPSYDAPAVARIVPGIGRSFPSILSPGASAGIGWDGRR